MWSRGIVAIFNPQQAGGHGAFLTPCWISSGPGTVPAPCHWHFWPTIAPNPELPWPNTTLQAEMLCRSYCTSHTAQFSASAVAPVIILRRSFMALSLPLHISLASRAGSHLNLQISTSLTVTGHHLNITKWSIYKTNKQKLTLFLI